MVIEGHPEDLERLMIGSRDISEADSLPTPRFDEIFERHYGELERLARAVVGDPGSAEDIVQDTFIKLNQSSMLARDEGEITAWLRRVCLNASLNHLRADRRLRERDERLRLVMDVSTNDHPDIRVLRAEERQRVRVALNAIPETLRACLLLRHSGYSYAEIAATLEIAVGSVGVYLARGERAFRGQFEENLP